MKISGKDFKRMKHLVAQFSSNFNEMVRNIENERTRKAAWRKIYMENRQLSGGQKKQWDKAIEILGKLIRPTYFESFILPTLPVLNKSGTLFLSFVDKFTRDWVSDHYSELMSEKIRENMSGVKKIKFVTHEEILES